MPRYSRQRRCGLPRFVVVATRRGGADRRGARRATAEDLARCAPGCLRFHDRRLFMRRSLP